MNYFEAPYEEVLKSVKSSESGLSKQEAERRLASDGPNEISEGKKKTVLQVFLSQFADVLVAILIVCSILSLLTGNIESTIVILLVITMNSVIGTVEHFKAEKSLSALKAMSAPHARVIRDGSVCDIPAREVVVGDILVLEAGSVASADGRVIEAAGAR